MLQNVRTKYQEKIIFFCILDVGKGLNIILLRILWKTKMQKI